MQTYQDRRDFSDMAHISAAFDIYPKMFNVHQWQLKIEQATFKEDTEQGIDYKVTIKKPHLPDVTFTVQERFRGLSYSHYKDVTIRIAGHNGSRQAELSALQADLMLYGNYDAVNDCIPSAWLIDVPKLKMIVLKFKFKPIESASNTKFIAIPFALLERENAILWSKS